MPARRSRRFDVVFYSPWLGPLLAPGAGLPPGGAETQILLLARALAARGLRVGLVVFAADGLPARTDGVEVLVQRRPRTTHSLLRPLAYAVLMLRLFGGLRSRFVVQRAAGRVTGLVALVTRAMGMRFVYSSANVVDFDYARLERRRNHVALFHLGVRLAWRIIVQTPEQDELCRRRFGRAPVMIKSIAEPQPPARAEPEAFLWIGRLTHYKRPHDLVALARSVPEARFRMVAVPINEEGETLLAEVREAAAGLDNLELLGPRPRDALGEEVERAVAIVNTADYEGMPNIFLEGWSRGVPALALRHDPDGVIERERVGAFAAGDPARLAEHARALWSARGDRALADRCRDYVAREHASGAVAGRGVEALGLAGAA